MSNYAWHGLEARETTARMAVLQEGFTEGCHPHLEIDAGLPKADERTIITIQQGF